MLTRTLLWLALFFGAACATQTPPPIGSTAAALPNASAATTTPWPEASRRFREGGAWLGADGAYSIDLGIEVLWLFADTFIDEAADGSRSNGPNFFIRNSVVVQTGRDAESAHDLARSQLSFHWGRDPDGTPQSIFHDVDSAQRWVWPLHGTLLPDGKLLVFRMEVVPVTGGFGFAVDSWDAIAIDDPTQPPESWTPRTVAPATRALSKLVGASVLIHREHLYAYAVENGGQDHAVYLARWPLAGLAGLPEGALNDPEWFSAGRFQQQSALGAALPDRLFSDGQNEFSVHFEASRGQFIQIQMQGLFVADPATRLGMRTAARPEGPWSALTPLYRPSESSLPNAADLAAYAAKAHPEQRGADMVLTYIANDVKHPTPPDSVYYPNLLRVQYH